MEDIEEEIRRLKIRYEAALMAMAYMPKESRPYTQQTADDCLKEMNRLIAELNKKPLEH